MDQSAKRIKLCHASKTTNDDAQALDLEHALGFQTETPGDNHDACPLLMHVLSFLGTSDDLIRTRQVCRDFRQCSDTMASSTAESLIGKYVRPMMGQSIVALLHGAEKTVALLPGCEEYRSNKRLILLDYDGIAGSKEGFQLGVTTSGDMMVLLPSGNDLAPGARIPVALLGIGRGIIGADLPVGFFHANALKDGQLGQWCIRNGLGRGVNPPVEPQKLINGLRLIRQDLTNPMWDYPFHTEARIMHESDQRNELPDKDGLYNEYLTLCMNMFTSYRLGMSLPNLDVFQEQVEAKAELLRLQEQEEEQARGA